MILDAPSKDSYCIPPFWEMALASTSLLGLIRPCSILFFLFSFNSHLLVLIYSSAPLQGPHLVLRELMLQYLDNQTIFYSPW